MGQQEDFRTPAGGVDAAAEAPAPPIFDERAARTAAPVVPLDRVVRRERFARWAQGGWRETVRSPQFRRSWPLALLVVATLAAAVAAASVYNQENAAPAPPAMTDSTAGAPASADAGQTAASPAPNEIENSRGAREARRENRIAPDAAAAVNPEAFAAPALGNFLGGAADSQDGAAAAGRDERAGERDKGKRQKRSKRRHGAGRSGGGAILFDVIR